MTSSVKVYIKKHIPVCIWNWLKIVKIFIVGKSFSSVWQAQIPVVVPRDSCHSKKISILCSIWNLDLNILQQTLDSVFMQTYPHWELCINCCCDATRTDILDLLQEYAKKDTRIILSRNKNAGIAENTNIAAKLATGDYICLLDHDDLLSPNALYYLLNAAENEQADLVYADEYYLFMKPAQRCLIRHKGPYELSSLRKTNYINHPVLISRDLFDEIGGIHSGFEGSQDYDLYLRIAEHTDKISYIPKPLYFWRIHYNSFSQKRIDICIKSGKRALEEHYKRLGLAIKVTPSGESAIYLSIPENKSFIISQKQEN